MRGSCLCGGVAFEADAVQLLVQCHCSLCRRSHGSAFRAGAMIPGGSFRWVSGEDLLRVYRAPSGYTAPFCRVCGSTAPWVSEAHGAVFVPCGLFDGDVGRTYDFHVFAGSQAEWWEITDERPRFPEYPPGYDPKPGGES